MNKRGIGVEILTKYLIWAAFFAMALLGVYFLLKRFGIL
tara:strand:- start:479 stop:595 length:117 start_codon:yes stop_codon:yes gene_type:complete